jgi:hypothetical protein
MISTLVSPEEKHLTPDERVAEAYRRCFFGRKRSLMARREGVGILMYADLTSVIEAHPKSFYKEVQLYTDDVDALAIKVLQETLRLHILKEVRMRIYRRAGMIEIHNNIYEEIKETLNGHVKSDATNGRTKRLRSIG